MNILEAKAHLRKEAPSTDDWEAYIEHRDLDDKANSILINEKYDMAVMQKVMHYADKLGRDEQSEGYDERYNTARAKVEKLLNSARLTRELKIRAIEAEITAINIFQNTIRDLSCFRISLEFEIEEDLKKELANDLLRAMTPDSDIVGWKNKDVVKKHYGAIDKKSEEVK